MEGERPRPTDLEAEQDDEQDYDLLTFGQAGARLAEELRAEMRRLTVLEGGSGTEKAVESSRHRVQALLEAQRRNRRTPFNDQRFEQERTPRTSAWILSDGPEPTRWSGRD